MVCSSQLAALTCPFSSVRAYFKPNTRDWSQEEKQAGANNPVNSHIISI